MRERIKGFWIFQFGGWLGYFISIVLTNLSNLLSMPVSDVFRFLAWQLIEMLEGIVITAFLRFIIIRSNILQKKLMAQIWFLFLSAIITSFFLSVINIATETLFPFQENSKYADHVLWTTWVSNFFIILVWNLFYFSYHYVVRSNRERLDKVRLESIVKDLELKTIKAHINPHFIFNALNSIRYLIDENPAQARNAVTQLSILLRSSLRAEDTATTPLENELEIVQSYLDLEKLRFEERLRISMKIDDDTRRVQVPPMMLQTLVENAIKHGVSKQVDGGEIIISSSIEDGNLILKVRNTGKFTLQTHNRSGFGITGTKNRLALMYGDKTRFSIKEYSNTNMVEAEVTIPVVNHND